MEAFSIGVQTKDKRGVDMLTDKEIDAIRFYQGDIRRRCEDGSFSDKEDAVGFWGIPRAYKTMNCLMFDGIDNEKERTEEDENSLNSQVILEIETVVEVFCDIFRAMCKYTKSREGNRESIVIYRTDRGISVQEMKTQGRTISFTSTSKENSPKGYFKKKKKLTLLEFVLPSGLPCLDLEEVLGDAYYYASQREILLPPFVCASFHEGKLTEAEESYRDADGQPPCGKYIVCLENILLQVQKTEQDKNGYQMDALTREKGKAAVILEKLKRKEKISEQELNQYCGFKGLFRDIIIEKFSVIQKEYMGMEDITEKRKNMLIADVKKKIKDFDERRKHYKKCMRICNIVLAVISVIPLICISMSFIDKLDISMRITTIAASASAMILTRIVKVEAYSLKLFQRTRTCLALRDLSRQMKYEYEWNEKKIDEYVQIFRKIMKEDTDMSWQNLQTQIENQDDLFQDEIIM